MSGNETRFSYEGRGLDYWLRELVADDLRRRDRAATAIQELRFRPPEEVTTSAEAHVHLSAFDAAIRAAIRAPGFDSHGFLTTLVRILTGQTPKHGRTASAQEAFLQSLAASFVFLALDDEILLVPDEIRAMLADPRQRWNAIQVIERLGPRALVFADDLVGQLDASHQRRPFDASDALAAVIRDDADRVRGIVDRLKASEPAVAEGAAGTLYSLGPRAAELAPGCVERLLAIANREGSPARAAAIAALGRVTQGTDMAVDPLLALSRSPENEVRGNAITALGDIGQQPEKVVPRLAEAFEDYREEDPDWTYYSAHERVVRALQEFGEAAIPAVPALTARVLREDDELDKGVIETLRRLGPAAREALPVLERLAEEQGYTAEDFASPEDLDEELDPVAMAIVRIRGR
jgi:HEAT repeat protein